MRDYILLFINGREHRISGANAFIPVTDYLRGELGSCGTKVVCAEGDCGACTVMLGRPPEDAKAEKLEYKPVNSCIQYVFQLDCSHIVTVEGLKLNGKLNPVQQSMVECHGAQCGYCTPGFVVAMCSMFDQGKPLSEWEIRDGLVGNLCRCTGYEPIVRAGLSVDLEDWSSFETLYPSSKMIKQLREARRQTAHIKVDGKELYIPTDVKGACEYKSKNAETMMVSGGTDVSVNMNKRGLVPDRLLSTGNIEGLSQIVRQTENGREILQVGARVTLAEIEQYISGLNDELKYILWVFGSPQIRHAATLAGNIANGSPIADTPPYLFVMDGEIEVTGTNGKRKIKMTELYKGYKKLAMQSDEMITRIFVPLPLKNEIVKLYKISRRQHLDISSFTAAFRLSVEKGRIVDASIAYGGVAPVIMRLPKVEEYLKGKMLSLATCTEAGKIARDEVTPISDVRGSKDYRLQLAENIFIKFYHETAERELVCQ